MIMRLAASELVHRGQIVPPNLMIIVADGRVEDSGSVAGRSLTTAAQAAHKSRTSARLYISDRYLHCAYPILE